MLKAYINEHAIPADGYVVAIEIQNLDSCKDQIDDDPYYESYMTKDEASQRVTLLNDAGLQSWEDLGAFDRFIRKTPSQHMINCFGTDKIEDLANHDFVSDKDFNELFVFTGLWQAFEKQNKSYKRYLKDEGWANALFHGNSPALKDFENFKEWVQLIADKGGFAIAAAVHSLPIAQIQDIKECLEDYNNEGRLGIGLNDIFENVISRAEYIMGSDDFISDLDKLDKTVDLANIIFKEQAVLSFMQDNTAEISNFNANNHTQNNTQNLRST